jgi:Mn2+/Fe2+ NRAMP family transporter
MGLLGTTISPWAVLWQAQGEREARRDRAQLLHTTIDVSSGYVGSNLFSGFIVVTTAATLAAGHHSIRTASDAAIALQPLAGSLATTLFALGILGAGLLAVPMYAICSGFAVAETFGWTAGLSTAPGKAGRFHAAVAAALLSGGLSAFLGVDPILALFYSQILTAMLMPILVVVLLLLANDRRVLGAQRNPRYYNVWLVLTILVMSAGAAFLLVGN